MKKLAIAASLVALAAPASAAAHGKHNHVPPGVGKAAKACKAERDSMGKEAFREKYANERGKRAFRRCVRQDIKEARQGCKAEREADQAAFREKYANKRGKRAFKRCVRANAGS